MKIVGSQIQQVLGAYLQRSGKSGAAGPSSSPMDEVSVSPRAGEVLKARQAFDQVPEVREDRVAAIRQRIQDGTYYVTNEQVARALAGGGRAAGQEGTDA